MRLPPSLWEFTLPFSPVTLTPWPLAARELTLAARGSIRHHATQYVVAGSQVIAPERSVAARRCKLAPPLFASSPLSLDFSRAAIDRGCARPYARRSPSRACCSGRRGLPSRSSSCPLSP